MSFFKSLFSPKIQRATVIEHLIESLARRQGDHCEHVKVLKFEAVEEFMKDRDALILSSGDAYPNESVLYSVSWGGTNYQVRASRSMDRSGVLITSDFERHPTIISSIRLLRKV